MLVSIFYIEQDHRFGYSQQVGLYLAENLIQFDTLGGDLLPGVFGGKGIYKFQAA